MRGDGGLTELMTMETGKNRPNRDLYLKLERPVDGLSGSEDLLRLGRGP